MFNNSIFARFAPHFCEVLNVNFLVYLQSKPEDCLKRIKTRGRPEEGQIKIEYFKLLHKLHEEWLNKKRFGDSMQRRH